MYTLSNVSLPHSPLSWMATTSQEGKSSCFHVSDFRVALMSVTALVLLSVFPWRVGYIGIQSLDANVNPLASTVGSCSAIMFTPFLTSSLWLMMPCWQMRDLLMFCCQIMIQSVRSILWTVGVHHRLFFLAP